MREQPVKPRYPDVIQANHFISKDFGRQRGFLGYWYVARPTGGYYNTTYSARLRHSSDHCSVGLLIIMKLIFISQSNRTVS